MIRTRIESIKLFALDILFPNRCPFCGKFIEWNRLCCKECNETLTLANDAVCHKCGQDKCRCDKESCVFDSIYASYFFDEAEKAVYGLKLRGELNFAELAAEDFVKRAGEDNIRKSDIIVPVPMGRRKRRKRGHNQAELFGKSIGKRLDIRVRNDILFKYDTADEQHYHTAEERAGRVKDIFRKGEADLSGMSVILCDDVMTTGSTLNRCAELLKEMGAETVTAVVCAVTRFK